MDNISGTYSTSGGSCKVLQLGSIFFVKYKRDRYQIRISLWLCVLSGIGIIISQKQKRTAYLKIFLGITDPISVLMLFVATISILTFAGENIFTFHEECIIAAVVVVGVSVLTYIATLFSDIGRSERAEVENIIRDLFLG